MSGSEGGRPAAGGRTHSAVPHRLPPSVPADIVALDHYEYVGDGRTLVLNPNMIWQEPCVVPCA